MPRLDPQRPVMFSAGFYASLNIGCNAEDDLVYKVTSLSEASPFNSCVFCDLLDNSVQDKAFQKFKTGAQ